MAIELRGGVRASALVGESVLARQAARFLPDLRSRAVSATDIQHKAQMEQDDGLDSALVTVASAWPDPWLVAAEALTATSELRVTVAHRPGVTAPTAAARTLATLDGLSGGRAAVHVVIGSSDVDVRRDGDFADKPQRYRRAAEYLEVFSRTLQSPEPFDYHGEFYQVAGALSGFAPVQQPAPPLSIGGASASAQQLAVRFADIYAGYFPSPEATYQLKQQLQGQTDGRALKFWKHFQLVLGESPQAARKTAQLWRETALHVLLARPQSELNGSPQLARDQERRPRQSLTPGQQREWAQAVVQSTFGGLLVGTVEQVAEVILSYHQAGIDIVQLEATTESADDRHWRRALIHYLRAVT